MKACLLLTFLLALADAAAQNVTHVQMVGPSTATVGTNVTYDINFWNGSEMVYPSQNEVSYMWSLPGATIIQESHNTIELQFTSAGSQIVVYHCMVFDNDHNTSIQVQVAWGNQCAGVNASAPDASRMGGGTVELTAVTAPAGFGYRWFDSDQTTQVGSNQSYTTPSLSSSKTYYLAYVHTASGCLTPKVPVRATISDHNYVKTYTAKVSNITESTIKTGAASQSYKDFTYFDGLGRPAQNVKRQATVNDRDLITPMDYDEYGRQKKEYLPYFETSGTQNGRFRDDAITDQTNRTNPIYGDTYGYAEKDFEPSPLHRVDKQAAPGSAWRMDTGKETKFSRRPNTTGDAVRIFTVNSNELPATSTTYGANMLWVEIMDDEDNKRVVEYTDKLGRVVLKKVQDTAAPNGNGHAGWLCTYYVYDDFGDLRVVIPPQAVRIMDGTWSRSTNTTLANAQYYRYKYDARRRLAEKRLPGLVEPHYFLYDAQDRQVGFQDGELRKQGKWLYTKYDALGRVVMTGLTVNSTAFSTLQTNLSTGSNNAQVKQNTANIRTGTTITSNKYDGYREYVASTSITLQAGFTMKATNNQSFTARIGTLPASGVAGAWPTDEGDILTVNYYDSYAFLAGYTYQTPSSPYTGFDSQASTRVYGLQTGGKVKNLETGELYTTAIFYDEKGRVIQTLSQHQMGGTVRGSIAYNFEDKPTQTLWENNTPSTLRVFRTFGYNIAGQLQWVKHGVNIETVDQLVTLAEYGYNDLGQQVSRTLPGASSADQTYAYNIRGWLTALGSNTAEVYQQDMYYDSDATHNRWNGNISRITWRGSDQANRTYNYAYDNANRLTTATYTAPGGNNRYDVGDITYDANGNILTMIRRGEKSEGTYDEIDSLTYLYQRSVTFGMYGNRLTRVNDQHASNAHTSKDFKPNTGSSQTYNYDDNGNQLRNADKGVSTIVYNHLNLPQRVAFTGSTGSIRYGYDAGGAKLRERVYNGSTLARTAEYVGEAVYADGQPDYLIHEEGRVVFEDSSHVYEFFVRDHLGNVRQVLREPAENGLDASMEPEHAEMEEAAFRQVAASRQAGPEHNTTVGGSHVAWLNAARGRMVGPGRVQEVFRGDRIRLSVYGKYEDRGDKASEGLFAPSGVAEALISDAGDLSITGAANPLALFGIADVIAKDLQKREAPEAYLMYALYDSDSNRYEVGKQVLSKNAANRHEVLEENLYIAEDGYMEAFVINETSEDVWFDDFAIMGTGSLVVQETHYDPWGLELTGLGFQAGGIKANRYLFNGKEHLEDHGLRWYDFGQRMYDPVIGRFNRMDRFAEKYTSLSPYQYGANNPILYIDINGDSLWISHKGNNYLYNNGQLSLNGAEYTGKVKGFLKTAVNALNQIGSTESGGTVLEGLQSSENNFYLQHAKFNPRTKGGNAFMADNRNGAYFTAMIDAGQGKPEYGGSGGNIYWNPGDGTVPEVGGGYGLRPVTNLGHELFHAYDANYGNLDNRPVDGLDRDEWRAVYFENQLRGAMGLPYRTHYRSILNANTGVKTGTGPEMLRNGNPIMVGRPQITNREYLRFHYHEY